MSGQVVASPPKVHHCRPGGELRWHEHDPSPAYGISPPSGWYVHDLCLPAGTVVECDCGKVYVAEKIRNHPRSRYFVFGVTWRRETRRERKRRLRV